MALFDIYRYQIEKSFDSYEVFPKSYYEAYAVCIACGQNSGIIINYLSYLQEKAKYLHAKKTGEEPVPKEPIPSKEIKELEIRKNSIFYFPLILLQKMRFHILGNEVSSKEMFEEIVNDTIERYPANKKSNKVMKDKNGKVVYDNNGLEIELKDSRGRPIPRTELEDWSPFHRRAYGVNVFLRQLLALPLYVCELLAFIPAKIGDIIPIGVHKAINYVSKPINWIAEKVVTLVAKMIGMIMKPVIKLSSYIIDTIIITPVVWVGEKLVSIKDSIVNSVKNLFAKREEPKPVELESVGDKKAGKNKVKTTSKKVEDHSELEPLMESKTAANKLVAHPVAVVASNKQKPADGTPEEKQPLLSTPVLTSNGKMQAALAAPQSPAHAPQSTTVITPTVIHLSVQSKTPPTKVVTPVPSQPVSPKGPAIPVVVNIHQPKPVVKQQPVQVPVVLHPKLPKPPVVYKAPVPKPAATGKVLTAAAKWEELMKTCESTLKKLPKTSSEALKDIHAYNCGLFSPSNTRSKATAATKDTKRFGAR